MTWDISWARTNAGSSALLASAQERRAWPEAEPVSSKFRSIARLGSPRRHQDAACVPSFFNNESQVDRPMGVGKRRRTKCP